MNKPDSTLAALIARLTLGDQELLAKLQNLIDPLPEEDQRWVYTEVLKFGGDVDIRTLQKPKVNTDDTWQIYTLQDAYQPREPIQYIVDGLFALPSLNILYGAPGDLKSMLLADLVVDVSAGLPWLPPISNSIGTYNGLPTTQAPVMWLDFDNGKRKTEERFEALSRARNLPPDAPLYYVSMPSPWLNASHERDVEQLASRILARDVKLCVIDNLGVVAGIRDENSSEMAAVMANLRRLAEQTGVALILIHHQRKSNTQNGRRGDSLRGHSSIEASLDLALQVERPESSSAILVRGTKVRGADVMPFGAMFTYEHRPDTKELQTARFFWADPNSVATQKSPINLKSKASEDEIRAVILKAVKGKPEINQQALIGHVQSELPSASTARIRQVVEVLESESKLTRKSGPHNAACYEIGG